MKRTTDDLARDEVAYGCTERPFKWTVEFTVSEGWVADGFDLTAERAHAILEEALPYAYGHELGARIIKAPSRNSIRKAQGYGEEVPA